MDTEEAEWLRGLLPKSAHKHIDAIIENFKVPTLGEVEVRKTHVAVEHIETYGLVIGLDAHGNANYVRFPHGADLIEDF